MTSRQSYLRSDNNLKLNSCYTELIEGPYIG